ncbi:hypothetical protein [Nostoc sp. CHAB 5715]|uniref:hypothetical protein n=1 Tax=Nostoc sp. CHAB 5715 TaxID=2780400 RepID=UPI001E5F74C5|nr:hypothetical protein [Nostoc sp. CHAB 5715]MCC5622294.1 hypothetical protein [Nostoc sp. CHAB 5715]
MGKEFFVFLKCLDIRQNIFDTLLLVYRINSDEFVVSALALKPRTKVLTTNFFTYQNFCDRPLCLKE